MAEMDIVSYLRHLVHDSLGVRVPLRVPDPRPAEFVVVRRNGGPRVDALRSRQGIDVYCWAASYDRARELSDSVSELMAWLDRNGFPDGIDYVVEETRRDDPDPESGSERWYASYTVATH